MKEEKMFTHESHYDTFENIFVCDKYDTLVEDISGSMNIFKENKRKERKAKLDEIFNGEFNLISE
jgi:thiaminase